MSYNGWTNRETWCVGLWFGDVATNERRAWSAAEVRELVEAYVGECVTDSFVLDLLDLGKIDYDEIANAWSESAGSQFNDEENGDDA